MRRLSRADWREATKLWVGNLLYYTCLASAIQLAGAPLPTMIIGTLPLVIAVVANLVPSASHGGAWRCPWACSPRGWRWNHHEMSQFDAAVSLTRYGLGILAAIGAVACWTWYPLRNGPGSRRIRRWRPAVGPPPRGWRCLPPALAGYLIWGLLASPASGFDWPLGPRPLVFVAVMLAIGLLASWLGTLMWNRASQLLPAALTGQLIVFETLAALGYAFVLRGALPDPATALGIALLCAGVLFGEPFSPASALSHPATTLESGIVKPLLLLILPLLLAACAGLPRHAELQPGVSDMAEVRAAFGQPYRIHAEPDGADPRVLVPAQRHPLLHGSCRRRGPLGERARCAVGGRARAVQPGMSRGRCRSARQPPLDRVLPPQRRGSMGLECGQSLRPGGQPASTCISRMVGWCVPAPPMCSGRRAVRGSAPGGAAARDLSAVAAVPGGRAVRPAPRAGLPSAPQVRAPHRSCAPVAASDAPATGLRS